MGLKHGIHEWEWKGYKKKKKKKLAPLLKKKNHQVEISGENYHSGMNSDILLGKGSVV